MAKWRSRTNWLLAGQIRADTITRDLRTDEDTISVWAWDGSQEGMDRVGLALAGILTTIDSIDVVVLRAADLQSDGLSIRQVDGTSLIGDLNHLHHDVERLDANALVRLAVQIDRAITRDENCRRFSRRWIIDVLKAAIAGGRVSLEAFPEDCQKRLA